MSSNPLSEALGPDFQTVFDVLANEQCRTMLKNLDRPKTASELASTCNLPRSTVYRKLEQMVDAGLLVKHEDGSSETRYTIDFDEVVVRRGRNALELNVVPKRRSASEQLSELWSGVTAQTKSD
ncbi:transcriptional regulator [Haloferax sp. Atlit-6N]|uniref:HTH domain protein n=1 Tax=Haloferax gibbonsii TaxID=35746 RepID=A0A871BKX7_HALGI|nr:MULTISPECIES: helix-turn-helix domain-containing protein [Haloferax]QOS13456.1 HTH domain protein [Haloferax gibbonsii]REA00551.1 transcriptional regulator [Haloferax sp. Atlit-6N]